MRLIRPRDNHEIARLDRPKAPIRRHLGLLVRPKLAPGEALWLDPCGGIHTFGMGYAIDVVFLDPNLRVLRVACNVHPWQVRLAPPGTRSVVELLSGEAARLEVGDELVAR